MKLRQTARASKWAPPQDWTFTDEERERRTNFWACPLRLVVSGLWARLVRDPGTTRGGAVVTSVLPVLALHTWPGKRRTDWPGEPLDARWTPWEYLSQRRVARLAGVNKDQIRACFERLAAERLLDRRVRQSGTRGGPRQYEYRLSAELYPRGGEPFAQVHAHLFYSGQWCMLPTPSARHLYIVVACLDPIRNSAALAQHVDADPGGKCGDDEVQKIRASCPMTLEALVDAAGMARSTVQAAMKILLTELHDGTGMLEAGDARPRGTRWYAPDPAAREWHWECDVLNDRHRMQTAQLADWGKRGSEVGSAWDVEGEWEDGDVPL